MSYILLIVIVDLWNVNKISYHIPCTAEWTSGRMIMLCSVRQQGDTPGTNG